MAFEEHSDGLGIQDRVDLRLSEQRERVQRRARTMFVFGHIAKRLTFNQCELLAKLKLWLDGEDDCNLWDRPERFKAEALAQGFSQKAFCHIFEQDADSLWRKGIIPQKG